ncbi:MAG: signal transduction protein [Gammaproteobacteria bacterium]|nr:MAG: signal transduction protein [Gammaproteobacteria bacterium]
MNLQLLVKSASQLFTLPEICIQLQDLIYDPASTSSDIAKLIAIDPSLAARLLKIANSSFYNFPAQIDTLGRAINLIGTDDLYNLALATSAPDAFSTLNNNDSINIETYWRHSVMSGLIGRALAQHCSIRHSERLFLSGLFHNLGQLVVLEQLPMEFNQIEKLKAQAEKPPWEYEKEVLGYDFAEVSTELLKCWKMPENILELVETQHDPSVSSEPRTASLIHIASRTASQIEYNQLSGYDFSMTILPVAWATTALDKTTVHTAISVAEMNCQTMLSVMSGKQMKVA